MKLLTFDEYLAEQLQDPEFKREYDKLEPWYQRELKRMQRLNALDDQRALQKANRASSLKKRPVQKTVTKQKVR